MFAFEGGEAADAGADHDAEAAWVDGGDVDSGVFHGHFGGGDGELDVAIGAAGVFGDAEVAVCVEVFDFAGDFAIKGLGVELLDARDAAATIFETVPCGGEVVSKRGDTADAGDDDASFVHDVSAESGGVRGGAQVSSGLKR